MLEMGPCWQGVMNRKNSPWAFFIPCIKIVTVVICPASLLLRVDLCAQQCCNVTTTLQVEAKEANSTNTLQEVVETQCKTATVHHWLLTTQFFCLVTYLVEIPGTCAIALLVILNSVNKCKQYLLQLSVKSFYSSPPPPAMAPNTHIPSTSGYQILTCYCCPIQEPVLGLEVSKNLKCVKIKMYNKCTIYSRF